MTPPPTDPLAAPETPVSGAVSVPSQESEAQAYRAARRRLRQLHSSLAGRRQDWANNNAQRCASARAVAYQSAMQSVHSILDEIEAIAGGAR